MTCPASDAEETSPLADFAGADTVTLPDAG
jgi:hypothetical protein